MRGFFLGLSLSVAFILGCVASQMNLVVPPAEAGAEAAVERQKWSYLCGAPDNADSMQEWANKAGLKGWEMVGGSGSGNGGIWTRHIWCFKRALR